MNLVFCCAESLGLWVLENPGNWDAQSSGRDRGIPRALSPDRPGSSDLRKKCKPPLGSHLSSAWAAPLIAFQSQCPLPLFLPCTLGLGLGSGLGHNCVPELRGGTPFWGILELLMLRPKSHEDGHSWRGFCSELEFKLQRVYFDVLTLGCEFCIRNWIPRVKGRQENLGNGCNFQLWYLSWALSSIRNYSGEFLLWKWVSCLPSFLGMS